MSAALDAALDAYASGEWTPEGEAALVAAVGQRQADVVRQVLEEERAIFAKGPKVGVAGGSKPGAWGRVATYRRRPGFWGSVWHFFAAPINVAPEPIPGPIARLLLSVQEGDVLDTEDLEQLAAKFGRGVLGMLKA